MVAMQTMSYFVASIALVALILSSISISMSLAQAGDVTGTSVASSDQSSAANAAGLEMVTMQIIHFNDFYEIEESDDQTGGASRLQTIRNMYPDALLTFGGDAMYPSVLSSIFEAQQMVTVLNMLQMTVATPGNHEFDQGLDHAIALFGECNWPWVVSNAKNLDGSQLTNTQEYLLLEHQGLTLGFIGLTHTDVPKIALEVSFEDPIESARRMTPIVRSLGADLVIAVTHIDMAKDEEILYSLLPGVDLIVGGHDHDFQWADYLQRPVYKSTSNAEDVGLLTMTAVATAPLHIQWHLSNIIMDASIEQDPTMLAVVQDYADQASGALDVVVGYTDVVLNCERSVVRTMEANIGNFVADSYREYALTTLEELGYDRASMESVTFGSVNGGGLRWEGDFGIGPITMEDCLALQPFGNFMAVLQLDGKMVLDFLEFSYRALPAEEGSFAHISGMYVGIDSSQAEYERVYLATDLLGAAIDPATTYYIGINSYTAFLEMAELWADAITLVGEADGAIDAVYFSEYLQTFTDPIAPEVEGRITIL